MKTTKAQKMRMGMYCILITSVVILTALSISVLEIPLPLLYSFSATFPESNILVWMGLSFACVHWACRSFHIPRFKRLLFENIQIGFPKYQFYYPKQNSGFPFSYYNPNFMMTKSILLLVTITSIMTLSSTNLQSQIIGENPLETKIKETLKKNSEILRFVENKGQYDNSNALYYLTGNQGTVIIEKGRLRFIVKERVVVKAGDKIGDQVQKEDQSIDIGQHSFSMYFDNGNPNPGLELGNQFSTKYNFFLGEESKKWVSGVHAAKDLVLKNVYPGVDLRLYSSSAGDLEFDWIMKPGVSYENIKLRFTGQDKLNVDDAGNLSVGLNFTDVKFKIPECYQVSPQGKKLVDFAFQKQSSNVIGFHTSQKLDPSLPTVIDPVLSWGTFMDGNDANFDQYLFAIQVDPVDGMIYCAGATNRNIPTNSPPYDADGYLNSVTGFGTGATPRVAIVYRVNSTGSDLVDLTLYGPSAVTGTNTVVAYGLSLSPTKVMIGGRTTVSGLPMVGSSFDNTFDNNDGFVAVFSRNLGSLLYSTYLGGTGTEDLGVTSIRAIDDNTFVCGMTAEASLPANYISSGAAQTVFGGGSDIYIAKFSGLNTLAWGTYIGGSSAEVFNDLELYPDGRVVFGGSGTGSLTEINSGASRSTGTDYDGIIGVLNNTGTALNYLDEIGGPGDDKINDVELNGGGVFYWTGSSSDGFPTTAGAYDQTHNGGLDVIAGTAGDNGGSADYKATFFGGGGDDLGSGIQKVSQTKCDGTEVTFLLIFGTTAQNAVGIPTVNINGDPFYDATNNGGLDMFFASFPSNFSSLLFSTNIGGPYNDYLGDTGEPRGANHLWVKGANIYCGTTTHSATHSPVIVGNTGFDQTKTNNANPTTDDTHVLFSIQFTSLFETDYSDAPASYGTPSHILDCAHIGIDMLDPETAPVPGVNANGDDLAGIDDEDGITVFPVYQSGGPQNISVSVDNIFNTTGKSATLYGWIDFNNDGNFDNTEFTSTSVANGFSGSKSLTWSSVTVSGDPSNQYLRIRLTTDALTDDNSTTSLDERSIEAAQNGEVEDYYICVKPKAGADKNVNCLASFPGGSATMAASGAGTWTAAAGNPGTATITNSSSATTTITNYSAAGTYAFVWTNATSCATDTALVIVTAKPNAGGNQTASCVNNFPGGSVTMGATGVGTWSAAAGNPGTATITSPNSPTTTITNFTIAGSYSFIWTNTSGCPDTAVVNVTAKPNAGSDKNVSCVISFPGGSTSMSATGTGTWTAHPSNQSSTIVTPSSPTTTINNFAGEGTYLYIWTIGSCTDTAAVIVSKGPIGSATPQSICSGFTTSVALNSTIPGTTFTWTAAQQSGAIITGYADCNSSCGTTISQTLTNTTNNASGVVRYTVIPTAPNGCVGNSFTVDVTVNPKPVGSGSNQTICSGATTSVNLNSTIAGTTYTWTAAQQSGATITGFSNCAAACGTTIAQTLTNTSSSAPGVVRYTVTPTSANGCSGNTFIVDVTVNPKPVGSASPETICSGASTSVALSSTAAGTTFTWTAAQQSGATITGFSNCASACGTTIIQTLTNSTNNTVGVVRYTVTPTSADGCIGNTFTVDVTVDPKPQGSASAQSICSGNSTSVALNSTLSGTTFTWTAAQQSGATITGFSNCTTGCGNTISQVLTNTSNTTAGVVRYTVTPTAPNGCVGNSFTVDVTVNPKPVGSGSNQTICSGATTSVNLNSTIAGTTYTWTAAQQSGATITGFSNCAAACGTTIAQTLTNTSSSAPGVVRYTVTPTSANGCSGNTFIVDVTVNPKPVGSASPETICSGASTSVALSSTAAGTTFTWTAAQQSGATITGFSNCASACGTTIIQTLTNSTNNTVGVVRYTVTPTSADGCIGNTFTVDVTVDPKPQGSASAQSICSGNLTSVALNSTLSGTTFTWTASQESGSTITGFSNCTTGCGNTISQALTNTSNTTAGVVRYTVTPTALNGCVGNTFTVDVTVNPKPIGSGSNQTICSGFTTSVSLSSTVASSTFTWTAVQLSGSTITGFSNCAAACGTTIAQTLTNTSNSAPGVVRYTVTPLSANGCAGNPFNVDVTVNPKPVGSASPETICSGATTSVALSSTAAGTTFTWIAAQQSGAAITGFSNCASACGTTIAQTLTNTTNNNAGVVRYTVTPTSADGCVGATFQVNVTVNPKPGVSITTTPACIGVSNGTATAVVTGGSAPFSYDWSNGQTSATITNLSNATYTVTVEDNNNCINTASGTVQQQGISAMTANPGACNPATNTYSVSGSLTLVNPPSSGTLTVSIGASQQVFNAPFNSPTNYTITGLTADGAVHTVNAVFSGGTQCSSSVNYTAPVNCQPIITHSKSFVSATQTGAHSFSVVYLITVGNTGGDGQYDLKDVPGFDDDIAITSASFTTNAPGNPGGALAGTGPWTLANDQVILTGQTHTYTLTVNVTIDLSAGSSGNNIYTKCGTATPGNPTSGEGLYNESRLDTNNDGNPEETKKTCGDIPYLDMTKSVASINPLGGNMYNVLYTITVKNIGGANGQYDLTDAPSFENDINIGSASYTSTAPGNAGSALAGTGPWILASDQAILSGATHTYTLTVKVTLDLSGGGGDNVYTKCGAAIPGDPSSGEGLYNQSKMDTNNDGTIDETDEACGDLPYVTTSKSVSSIVPLGGNMYNVIYSITAQNLGGATGQYDLTDAPGFDDDITIGSASFTTNAPGNPGGSLAGTGPWTLANDQNISAGATHTYTLTVKVTLDLRTTSAGNNVYTKCGTAIPGDPAAGEGLYNQSKMDSNNDGIPEETREACADLPYIVNTKSVASISPLGGNMYNVVYSIQVKNLGGVNGSYDLIDAPGFDNDFSINNASYTSNAPGNPGLTLVGTGPWTLANDQNIVAGATHTYTLTVKVTLDLTPGSGGDNVYTKCGNANPGDPQSGEGLYNQSRVDSNNDGIAEDTSEVCSDVPYITTTKSITSISSLGGNMYNVSYTITAQNIGGLNGQYDLTDTPGFDDDITINSASYTSNAPGNAGSTLVGTGPWTLANDQSILVGATHTYTLIVKVTLDLSAGSGGNNIYKKCGTATPGDPAAGEGLYNQSAMDSNNDGVAEETKEACGDLPYIVSNKSLTSITPLGGNMYNVVYAVTTQNLGGANGQYDLTDVPGFDDDFTINSASYVSNAPGNGGSVLAGSGPWILANDQAITAGATHTYTLTVKVTLSLRTGSGGDNSYTKCGTAIPGDPTSGEGLYNQSKLDTNNDGTPEDVDEVCGDVPYITNMKSVSSVTPLGGNMYTVVYQVLVKNSGGANGQYDLIDAPGFDDDFTINSASYTSNAPGNPGAALVGSGPWTLSNDQAITAGATHTFTITVKVTLDLSAGSGGNNVYTKCGSATPGDPTSGEGLYNRSTVDVNNDGIPEDTSEVCTDLSYITSTKTIASIIPLGGNMYNVTYNMTVQNQGGINGQYDLTDAPGFDNDFTLISASYTSNAPGNPGSTLVGTGPWTLANDQAINAGSTHTYVLTVKVTLDLTAGSGGDNIYTKCGNSTPGNPTSGEGLYNESRLDINNDGVADELREVCGDVPYVTTNKSISSINSLGGNMYNVSYSITVQNLGGTTGQYDLSDVPGFDDDITINSASYTSNAPGNAGAALAGTGPWTLANDQSIVVGATHTYTLVVKVTLDLRAASSGNNVYTKCGTATPGDPAAGEGLYNQSKMDANNDGIPEETKEVCGDIPYITTVKTVNSVTPLGGNMFNVSYQIQVKNTGGANGSYDLIDAPGFDNDFAINSSSYTSNAPGNAGSSLAGNGPWTLANDQAILTGATHTYTVIVKVTLDLTAGSGGDNIYTACGSATPGDPTAGEGLYNRARVDINNDGIPEDTSETCADVPYITSNKSLTTIAPLGGNMYNVTYTITVQNLGASAGQYDLLDVPAFDNDITIGSATYTTTAPGNAGGALAGTGPWTLANDQAIVAGGTHTYTLVVKVTLDLTAGTSGDNIYTKCGNATPGNPTPGEGLYNESRMDSNNDGTPEETKKACGDLPYIVTTKTFTSKTDLGGNMYNVNYTITVQNLGGAVGQYDLTDVPEFDDDITINNASYTSNAPGNAGAPLAGSGPWTLANDQNINVGAVHTYTLTVKATIDLSAGSGGNNTYTKCGNNTPGDPQSGEGLYNQSRMDTNNDGVPEDIKEACGDLPYVTTSKTIASITALGGNMFEVKYKIVASNAGGVSGQYDLTDIPGFDNDITINSASYASDAPGNSGGSLTGSGPWTLANDQSIAAGVNHTYTITVKVTIDLSPGSGGDNLYTKCGSINPGDPQSGEGLYNQSRMDTNNDGVPEDVDEVCGDLPYITSTKNIGAIVPLGGNTYNVTYNLTVQNLGAVNGQYDLTDIPGFDNDININSASFTTTAPGNPGGVLAGTPWVLANDQAIAAGASHTYTITVNVTLNLEPGSGGDNIYTKCGNTTPGDPTSGEGLYNQSRLDSNNDGTPEEIKEACGDIPYVSASKSIASISPLGGNMYNVTYSIVVRNLGGVGGQYDLSDVPGFDNDITIGSASYTSSAPGNPGGPLAGSGPWQLANDQTISVGSIHTYTLVVKVTLDLNPGSGGDNSYTKCGALNPGDPQSGEGLYNQSKLDSNNDGTPEDIDETCGDLPYVTSTKTISSINNLGGNMYNVTYSIVVRNLGGANGTYDLNDVPGFDNDINIVSASYGSTAPGNPGGGLAGSGPWTLANDQAIGIGAIHTYTLTVKVTLDLRSGTPGDNIYTACGNSIPGDPSAGEGLYNQSRLDSNNDGTPEEIKEACGDLPYIINTKTVNSVTPLGGNMFNVKYNIVVKNIGGANGQYDLLDVPGFDNDFAIGSASYTSDAPGNAGSALAGSGPWTLANDQAIVSGTTHNYVVTVKVTLDLTPGSGGDNVYTKCGSVNPADPNSGEGLYNQTRVDINNDGIPEDTSETCADIPYITSAKTINSITSLGGHMYNVVYKIVVKNLGGAAGQYDLSDVPGFDNDIAIGSASYSSDAPGNAGGSLAGIGPWSLANDQLINANATHTYLVSVKVTLDLDPASGGDNVYTKCGQVNPNDPRSGEGLYNESRMDSNNDGTPEEVSKVCGDLPYVVSSKTFTGITPLGGNMFNVKYKMVVQNLGGIAGPYDLTDVPGFDDDITINSASYTTDAPGNPGGVLAGSGPWVLANDQNINNGSVHTYNLSVKVTLDLDPASSGNNTYTKCGSAIPGDPNTGEGLYNQSKLDINNDGVPEDVDEACGDVPYVTSDKSIASITPLGGNMYTVKYQIRVQNLGGTPGMYDLVDQPGLDDDIAMSSVSYTSDAPGNPGGSLIGTGPWTLANDQAIGVGGTHIYILTAKMTLDLSPTSGGNNVYTHCGNTTPGDPIAGEGLYNQSKLDNNNDGQPEEIDEVCGDLPYVTTSKTLTNISSLGGHMYNVTYEIVVKNLGGALGQYDLTDVPGFDNDIAIGSASYVSTAPGNPGSPLIGNGPWILANDQNIGAFSTQVFTITVKVTLNLEAGSGGDDIYTKCNAQTPGDPTAGEGLYNQSRMDSNNDGTPEEVKEACGDLPYVVNAKTLSSITPLGGNMYTVVYQLTVKNLGGVTGVYDLVDVPGFDNDIVINNASFTTTGPGAGGVLAGNGPWTLANNLNIPAGTTHTYTITLKVTIQMEGGAGDDRYVKCGEGTPGDPTAGEGLYNQAKLDINDDGIPEDVDEACGDLPYVTSSKSIAAINPLGGNMYNVVYKLTIRNLGGTTGQYDLKDTPGFDDDITIGSASYTTNAPGNPGGALAGTGPWTLANDQNINAGATHTYTLTVKVTIDLNPASSGNNIYTTCGEHTPGDPEPGEGLYNQSSMDSNNDGTPEELDEVCDDLPFVTTNKTLTNISSLGGHMYNLTYVIEVKNLGGANGQYDLSDAPGFDNDIAIGSASYTTTAPGNTGGVLAGAGPWTLANDQNINAFSSHTYTITIKVTLNLEAGSSGDNIYTKCNAQTPGDPAAGEGLYNQSRMDSNNDGTPEEVKEACGDLPYVVNAKTLSSITPLGGNMYTVVYQLTVRNLGGATGVYDLVDVPGFDNDIVINNASFTTTGPGAGGVLAGNGPWTLADDLNISAGATHTYTITLKVTIQMEGGAGDDRYVKCGEGTPGDPTVGEGLYNQAKLDINNDGNPEDVDEACGDLPYVTSAKSVASITNLGGHMYNVAYTITVRNLGGASGQYDLNDIPGFDDDITINNANYTSNAPGNAGGALAGSGPWILANDQNINAGATHTYTLTVKVTIDLRATSGGNNVYSACGESTPGDPNPGQGLYNQSTMDSNNDGIPEEYDEACADLPYVVSSKEIVSIIPLGGGMHTINYRLIVKNLGGAVGQYDLTDAPGFDNDLTINTASYTSTAPGNPGGALAGAGPWVLANDQNIAVGATHTYNLTVKATLDLRQGSGGDNVYTECGQTTPGTPKAGEGVFNQSRMDINNDGIPEDVDDVCGDIDIVDMAIRKTIATPAPYSYGQLLTFNLEVFNQGNIPITSIILNDYLPSGFTFSPADNIPGWSQVNPSLLEFNAVANIPRYASTIVPLKLRVARSSGYKSWFNYSEVKSYKDVLGNDRTFEELDSKPNSNTPAELAVLPGDPGDDNISTMEIGGNEDDHDPAGFNVFDVALRKVCKGNYPLNYSEVVPFEITVFNQGSISATNVQITDYVPAGFQFVAANNPSWTYNSGTREALTTLTGKIKPGDSAKVTINLVLLPILGNPKAWDNIGEIESITDTLGVSLKDFDSTPGGTKDDDGPAIDDAIDDPNDEDDHDPSVGPVFDLAMKAIVINKAPYYIPGDVVPFTMRVFNQGNITAMNIQINDYIPQGYVFNPVINPGWSYIGSTLVYNSIAKLNAGDSIDVPLKLTVQIAANPTLQDWDNYAELRTAMDAQGVVRDVDDADSKPNTNSAWEKQVVENHPWDNVVDGNGQIENEDEDDHDFENVKVTGAIGDRVWDDLNGNGIQDSGEPGLPNVIASLYDCNTLAIIKKDTTDANGLYLFDFLLPLKSYFVKYDFSQLPPGYGFTFQNRGSDDSKDSDVSAGGVGPCLVVEPGKRDSTYDAGLVKLGSFSDFVWNDKDGDGIQDPAEEGIQGVTVIVYDAVTKLPVKNAITDANGHYLIKDLMPMDYYLKFVAPSDWIATYANTTADFKDSDVDNSNGPGTTATTHLSPGEDDSTVDAGFYKCIKISGDVWFDLDMDGIYDPEEKGINGLHVEIIDAMSGATVTTLITSVKPGTASDDGYYIADCLRPGMYYIRFERPGHLGASEPYKGPNPNRDSDISHENGVNTTKKFTVISGDIIGYLGGGFQTKSLIGDHVWIDKNFNGLQDTGEQPLPGVKVEAYKSSGVIISEATTGTDGQFMLDGVVQGDYFVKFTLPNNYYGFTQAHVGSDNVDSDVDGTYGYGTTKMYRILAGEVRPTIDAGVVAQALPLQWLGFEGQYNGTFTELNWITGVEFNNDYFVVERRHESDSDFSEIGQVEADKNASASSHKYSFNDYNCDLAGTYYYRLKQVDKNGFESYSRIIAVSLAKGTDLKLEVSPNPVRDLLHVKLWLPEDGLVEARVYDQHGKTVMLAPFNGNLVKGYHLEHIQTNLLPSGDYILQIVSQNGVINKVFTVMK